MILSARMKTWASRVGGGRRCDTSINNNNVSDIIDIKTTNHVDNSIQLLIRDKISSSVMNDR